ncbi:DNA polymerase III subunit delta [candidate division WOR-3 bacterium]|nr:DNA polymerase III subunit delta [candidate division WOR-3 bacterium]
MAGHAHIPTRKPADVLADIKRGKLVPVYILFGADSAAADELLQGLKAALVQPGMEAFDFESVHADELEIPILLQHIRQPPVASKRRLVIVRGIDRLSKGRKRKDEEEDGQARGGQLGELLTGIAALPQGCAVALTCDWSKPMQNALAGSGLGKYVVDLRQPGTAELASLLHRRAKELDISLEPGAVQLLLDVSGDETTLLLGELDKLATAVDPGDSITADDVRRLAGQSREFELNEYVGLVLRGHSAGALAVLERLRNWGEEPVKIVAWLGGVFLRLVQNRGDEKRARLCLLQLYEINRDIISGHPEPFALLETFTVCAACPAEERYCPVYNDAEPPEFCIRRKKRRDRTRGSRARVPQ